MIKTKGKQLKVKTETEKLKSKTNTFNHMKLIFFFYLGFFSQPFTNHGTAGEGGGHFFNSSLPLPPASQTLRH